MGLCLGMIASAATSACDLYINDSGDNGSDAGTVPTACSSNNECTTGAACVQGVCAPQPATLVVEIALPVGDPTCHFGGTEIDSGTDDGANGGIANDGILEPGEVTSTSYLCVEQPVPPVSPVTLLLVTPLMAGDPHCTYGGTEYQTGLDNGANGGVAGDGILESGEVTQTSYMCLGSPT